MAKSNLREWAVKGAEQRLVELADEARTIFAAFPELRGDGRRFEVGRDRKVATATVAPAKRRRKAMSAATRRKIALAPPQAHSPSEPKKGRPSCASMGLE